MASPQRTPKDILKMVSDTKEETNCVQRTLEKLQGPTDDQKTEEATLRSRIDDQSHLILILKQRADNSLLRYQALQKTNTGLEGVIAGQQKQLDHQTKKSTELEKRFMDLAANHQEIIKFKDEYKRQNAQLRLENQELRTENDTLFSKKMEDMETLIDKLSQEIKEIEDKHKNMELECQKKTSELQLKLKEQEAQHQSKEASLLDKLHNVQKQLEDAVEMCRGLKVQLLETEDGYSLKVAKMKETITNLTKEKDKFLNLSMERGKVIQGKQDEIQQLEAKRKNEEKARMAAEDRFNQEAATVNAQVKVRVLQCALDESTKTCERLRKEFEAYKEHSTYLLTQEKELNAKLRHLIG